MANSFADNSHDRTCSKQGTNNRNLHGEIGVITRLLANRLGSPFTYATFSGGRKMAPGQLDWKEMRDLYKYESIDEDTGSLESLPIRLHTATAH